MQPKKSCRLAHCKPLYILYILFFIILFWLEYQSSGRKSGAMWPTLSLFLTSFNYWSPLVKLLTKIRWARYILALRAMDFVLHCEFAVMDFDCTRCTAILKTRTVDIERHERFSSSSSFTCFIVTVLAHAVAHTCIPFLIFSSSRPNTSYSKLISLLSFMHAHMNYWYGSRSFYFLSFFDRVYVGSIAWERSRPSSSLARHTAVCTHLS